MPIDQQVERVRFGLYEADLSAGELWRGSFKIKLSRQPFRVLTVLLLHAGRIVTRQELQQELWGKTVNVDFDQAIAASINKIREAIGDTADNPRFIETLPKRGYRFIAPVLVVSDRSDQTNVPATLPLPDALIVGGPPSESESTPVPHEKDGSSDRSTLQLPVRSEFSTVSVGFRPTTGDIVHPDIRSRVPHAWIWCCSVAAILVLGVFGAAIGKFRHPLFASAPGYAPLRVDQLTHYVSISLGPPNPESFLSMAVDGDRVISSVMNGGRSRLSSIDIDTGESQPITVPDDIALNALLDMSKDGSRLLLKDQQSTESEQPLWVVPTVGGSGRRLSTVLAHDATWMPNQKDVLYAAGNDLLELQSADDSSHLYARLKGRAFWMRWSPDGQKLRFTLSDPVTHVNSLWELQSSDRTSRPVPLSKLEQASVCCGMWLPDGRAYVFQADENLWLEDETRPTSAPVQLTNGPLRSLSPIVGHNGKSVYFIGLEAPAGLQQFDSRQGVFRPAPAFLAEANRIEFSRDGLWVAWTDLHEHLWRARSDGSDKVRLTSDALEVFLAHWSPDGKRLALMARKFGGLWQTYLMDASGGEAKTLLNEKRNSADPTWSPDGTSLIIGREPDLMGKESGTRNLELVNIASRQAHEIPGSDGLFSPRWSPDGKWVVALTADQNTVMLWDVGRRRWVTLAHTSAADPVWSQDSRRLYVHAFLQDKQPILSVTVPDGATHIIADGSAIYREHADNYFFGGITPAGSPMIQPRVGVGNLYSLRLPE